MNEKALRAAFEYWYSDDGKNMQAVERNPLGSYILAQANTCWSAWLACHDFMSKPVSVDTKPLSKAPKQDALYFLRTENTVVGLHWQNDHTDNGWLKDGRCYATQAGALAALEMLKGEVVA